MMGPLAALNVDWAGSELSDLPYALYFFKRRQYIRWDIDRESLCPGYPRDISEGWPGLLDHFPDSPLSGAIHVPGWNNRIFFLFHGQDRAVSWDVARHKADAETVPVATLLPTRLVEGGGPFAPVYVDRGEHKAVYVFRGDEYTRFTVVDGNFPTEEDSGYPSKIGNGWTGGLTVAPTCGVSVRWTSRSKAVSSHKVYFFLGELYTRWDITSHTNNYRLDIPSGWKGWPSFD